MDHNLLEQYAGQLPKHSARIEVLLAELRRQEPSMPPDDILLTSKGLASRGYSKDVFSADINKNKNSDYILKISLNREGLYDMLPKSLFHPPLISEGWQNIDRMVAESKKLREEELAARQFFLPFEQCYLQQRTEIEEMEQTYMTGFLSAPQKAILDSFWPDVQQTEDKNKALLFYMLPLAHRISGDILLIEQCFETLLLNTIKIQYLPPQNADFDEGLTLNLGDTTLGANAILGSSIFEEVPSALVRIGPVNLNDIPDYIQGGKKAALLSVLYDFFIPLELNVQTDVFLASGEKGFYLDESEATSRLGFSTVL